MRLGELLIQSGLVQPEDVEAALLRQQDNPKRRLGEVLTEEGLVTEEDLLQTLARQFGMMWIANVTDDLLDPALVEQLPVEWARSQRMLPIRLDEQVGVLTADPMRVESMDDLALLLGCEPVPVVATVGEIVRCIEQCYFERDESTSSFLESMSDIDIGPDGSQPVSRSEDLLRVADNAPVTQLVNLILREALKARASDVHIEPFEKFIRVRYRVDGLLYDQTSPPKHLEAALVSRLKVMARLDIAEKRLPQDGMARVRVGDREVDIRVSTIPIAEGERLVLRLLNLESALLPLAQLGMPDSVFRRIQRVVAEPNGIVLVTGPTGSGKTTSLYAALQEMDTSHKNVLTIEDPIEYQLPKIGQIQVKPKIGLTFAHGLRHILRQDPDVILVGEVRDAETAEVLVRASLTGHLVFSTLHTNDAASAVLRLADMGIEPYLLSAAMRASMAQRLVRCLCSNCKQGTVATEDDVAPLGHAGKELVGKTIYRAGTCDACLRGYRGRTGLYELIDFEVPLQDAIHSGCGPSELRATAQASGMPTMLEDGVAKIAAGETSVTEVVYVLGQMAP